MTDRIHWWLDEADRLDKRAAELDQKPAPVAAAAAMTEPWIEATLGPDQLRTIARNHREHAARLARKANQR